MPDYENRISWPGWEIVRLIGRGSFGAVYEIERDMLGEKEKAALKVITIPQSSSDIDELYGEGYDDESITSTFKAYLKSIVAEYSLMRKMNGSANVVNCDDVCYVQHDDGFGWDIFIKMELLTPLTKSLVKTASDEQVVRIGSDICKALILCKKHNIIHRDIKPANIFVSENGDYKLGDFGIAKTVEKTSGGTKIGTYEYMAPEVYHDQPYGSTVDIYSLGMVLYWLLNERRTPFLKMPPSLPTNSEKEYARKRRFGGEAIPTPVHGSDELKRIVLKACAFDPKDRFQSAQEMLTALLEIDGTIDFSFMSCYNTMQPELTSDKDPDETLDTESSTYKESTDNSEDRTLSAFSSISGTNDSPTSGTEKPRYLTYSLIAICAAIALIVLTVTKKIIPVLPDDLGTSISQELLPVSSESVQSAQMPLESPRLEIEIQKKSSPECKNLEWSIEKGVLTISGSGNMTEDNNSFMAPWASRKDEIKRVVIESGITSIGDKAFADCTRLVSAELPESIEVIGEDAFANTALSEIFIPSRVTEIKARTFMDCYRLRIVEMPTSIISIGDSAFQNCERLPSIEIPFGVVSIGTSAFSGCSTLMDVIIPSSVSSIGEFAFSGCKNLYELEIPVSVSKIGAGAFSSCHKLQSVKIASTVNIIEKSVFSNCDRLIFVELPSNIETIGDGAFSECISLKELVLPGNIQRIGEKAFFHCYRLKTVEIPNSINIIMDYAFAECTGLKEILYRGTQGQWNAISISVGNTLLEKARIVFNVE